MLDSEDGFFSSEEDRINRSIDSYDKQYEKMEARMEAYRTRLVNQFAQVEMLMTSMQTQSAGLASMPAPASY